MRTLEIVIVNPRGLHSRACARIVEIARHCRCNLQLIARGRRAVAHNIFAVMMLTATVGTAVRIEADGPDEEIVMKEIATLFRDGLGERR